MILKLHSESLGKFQLLLLTIQTEFKLTIQD